MSIIVADENIMHSLTQLQEMVEEIKRKLKRGGRPHSNQRHLDVIRNAVLKKINTGEIPPEYITVEYLAYGCQILKSDAEEIYAYLKTLELI